MRVADLAALERELEEWEATQQSEPYDAEAMDWWELERRQHDSIEDNWGVSCRDMLRDLGYRRDTGLRATRVG